MYHKEDAIPWEEAHVHRRCNPRTLHRFTFVRLPPHRFTRTSPTQLCWQSAYFLCTSSRFTILYTFGVRGVSGAKEIHVAVEAHAAPLHKCISSSPPHHLGAPPVFCTFFLIQRSSTPLLSNSLLAPASHRFTFPMQPLRCTNAKQGYRIHYVNTKEVVWGSETCGGVNEIIR